MKLTPNAKLTRRGLGSLLVAGPAVARSIQEQQKSPPDEARESYSNNRKRLKAVVLAREVEPSFRFEP
jgi:hypothetical protein